LKKNVLTKGGKVADESSLLPFQILRTFFALIFGTILFSLLVGLIFLPVALSLIGPAYVAGIGPPMTNLPVIQPQDGAAMDEPPSKASGSGDGSCASSSCGKPAVSEA